MMCLPDTVQSSSGCITESRPVFDRENSVEPCIKIRKASQKCEVKLHTIIGTLI